MGLPVMFLLGRQSDVPDYFYFRRPRQFHPYKAVRASHSGDVMVDGQPRHCTGLNFQFCLILPGYDGTRRLCLLGVGVLQFQPRPEASD